MQGPLDTTPLEAEEWVDEQGNDSPTERIPVNDVLEVREEETQNLG